MGLTPRICEDLFNRIELANTESSTLCYKTMISYMEIYNEKLRDLFDTEPPSKPSTSSASNIGSIGNGLNPLNPGIQKSQPLKIREHPTKGIRVQFSRFEAFVLINLFFKSELGIYVQNLNQHNVTDLKTTMKCLNKGNQNRSTASTHVHDKSSRSHAIFTITFIQVKA